MRTTETLLHDFNALTFNMDIPEKRIILLIQVNSFRCCLHQENLRWLQRNLEIRNSNHTMIIPTMRIISELLDIVNKETKTTP